MSETNPSNTVGVDRRSFLKRASVAVCGVGGVAAACASLAAWSLSSAKRRLPTILLITLDTTRADHLGCYGYPRPTSPHLDRFAAESLVFEQAISSATWTLPAHVSLFTGKFTASHGVCKALDGELDLEIPQYGPEAVNHYRSRSIAADERMLAEFLSDAGYATAAIVAGPWMKRVFGLDRGFDVYDDENIETVNARPAEEVTDRALHLMSIQAEQPQFLFLNYFDPHFPYAPPSEFIQRLTNSDSSFVSDDISPGLQQRIDRYDAEIMYLDHHLGRLFEGMRSQGLFDEALIVVTGDHGEMLGEHGVFGHPGVVYQEAVHVPLIVKQPRRYREVGRRSGWT
jgi:arylsulfatase